MTVNGPDKAALAKRRAEILERLGANKAVLFLPGAPEVIFSKDVHYRYRPASNIRYLSGFEEPAALLLGRCGGGGDGFTLFVQPRDAAAETWTGKRAGVEGALGDYDADHAYPLAEVFDVLEQQLRRADALFYEHSRDKSVNERVLDIVHAVNAARPRAGGQPLIVTDAGSLLDEMRLVKRKEEIATIRKACHISAMAHVKTMETFRPGMYEYQVEALLEHAFRDAGCAGPAYGTIAASASDATVLHYTRNDKRLEAGHLLLIDAGGEYGGYCADITRTSPVGGSYSREQAAVYDVVLAAQQAAIAAVSPSASYDDPHKAALQVLVRGMLDLGLLEGTVEGCIESEAYKDYYMHGTSHWLGMDVHDVGSYRGDDGARPLEPGILLTVEPGLYVKPDAEAPEALRGIGVRIEDDVLVTQSGAEVLTDQAPKARSEIEALRRKAFSR